MSRFPCRLAVFLAATVVFAAPVRSAVEVEDDEVLFTLAAPSARNAFVVGDFNNWNPTLEKMDRNGELFEVRLFLLPGAYRYKFVVDGQWINDPDDPSADPTLGSPLVLDERAGVLVLAGEPVTESGTVPALKPGVRYTGGFLLDDGKTHSDQTVDVYFSYKSERLRSSVDFKTIDATWDISPLKTEIDLERGFVELRVGGGLARGFENDSLWSSVDPFHMVGGVGVYGYNAGFERTGVSFESAKFLSTQFRAMYTDKMRVRSLSPVVVSASAFGGFASSTTPDTTLYRYDTGFGDEDSWAVELFADMGSLQFGYVKRENRGLHRGVLVTAMRRATDFRINAFNTREQWRADVVWLKWRLINHVHATGAYGDGEAKIRRVSRSASSVVALGDVIEGRATEAFDSKTPLLESSRWYGELRYEHGSLGLGLSLERNGFDSEFPVPDGPDAKISVLTLDGSYTAKRWRLLGRVRFVDQDYGATPEELHFDTADRNYWLDYGERLDVKRMVSFDLDRATDIAGTFVWGPTASLEPGTATPSTPLSVRGHVSMVSDDVFERIELVTERMGVEWRWRAGFYAQVDGRLAWYNKPEWRLEETYFDPYFEAGYRRSGVELSIGFGQDPVVLDPVTNRYADIGRDEFLRRAVFDGLRRDGGALLGGRLRAQEAALEDIRALKLELILLF